MKCFGFEILFLELLLDHSKETEYVNDGLRVAKQNIKKKKYSKLLGVSTL